MDEKPANDSITINKKVLRALAPVIAILGVLVSKGEVGPLLLFLLGIAAGIYIGMNYKVGTK
ncbi:hypothetical protein [Methanococcoides methylutens]|uniref:hypothetical protein n=1 Tax=Methanococcoides methylutens TaxID=2226 RepID=UPI00064FFF75|nr:hypothetical protein [Methanococcoides methylutens]